MDARAREDKITNRTIIAAPIVALIAGVVVWLFEPNTSATPVEESVPSVKEVAEA